tara:strand:- start:4528 stop:5079 length:552 start_codon:yes stop_codon:yes gene_type:complete
MERIGISSSTEKELQEDNSVSSLLTGEIEPVSEIFLDEKSSTEILNAKKETDQIMIETAAIGESFSGRKMGVDSSIAIDSDFIINVTKKISSLDSKFSGVRKPDSIKARLTENKELFFSDITDMMQQIEEMVEKFGSIDEIELEESDKDLLVRHHASILESVRLDREIRELSNDLDILKEEVG